MKSRVLVSILLGLQISACSTVTIRNQGEAILKSAPDFSDSYPFYFWGLAGSARVNVLSICNAKRPVQMQTKKSFKDAALTLVTLGIYYPRTAAVWCVDPSGAKL